MSPAGTFRSHGGCFLHTFLAAARCAEPRKGHPKSIWLSPELDFFVGRRAIALAMADCSVDCETNNRPT